MKNVKGNLKNTEFYKDTGCGCIVRAIWLPTIYCYKTYFYKRGPGCFYNNSTFITHDNYISRIHPKYKKIYLIGPLNTDLS